MVPLSPLVEIEGLKKYFPLKGGLFQKEAKVVHAVDGISFRIEEKQTFSLVGESGSGKTTTGLMILGLLEPTAGRVRFKDYDIFAISKDEIRNLRREMQMVFQDPFASLNPRKSVYRILSQAYKVQGITGKEEVRNQVLNLMEKVGFSPADLYVDRYPHELSGGQRQRISVARAIAVQPKFIVADEPVSALDISVRSQILNLMIRLQRELDLTYLFITHDLAVVRSVSTTVGVMYVGKIVELAKAEELFSNPLHPYTKALLSAIPLPNPVLTRTRKRIVLTGDTPSPITPPQGCRFHTRCPFVRDDCKREPGPWLIDYGDGHLVACPYAQEIKSRLANA